MPLQYVRGDLLSSGADILTIPVNCVGVAGCGLALQCKQRYPEWFTFYRSACTSHLLFPGRSVLHLAHNRFFVSFPTKDHWREVSQLGSIEKGLQELVACSGPWRVPSWVLAVPRLGCGAGGLSWSQVQPVMEHYLGQLPCTVWIFV
jgi:hypothetical protein